MHILTTDNLIHLVNDQRIDGAEALIKVITQAQAKLADMVASHFAVQHATSTYEYGAIHSAFAPSTAGQICPEPLADMDEGSDWVQTPEEVEPATPMIVLYRDPAIQKPMDAPIAFRCSARNDEQAEKLCHQFAGSGVEVLWVVETTSTNVALDSYWRAGEPRPELASEGPTIPIENEVTEYPFALRDHESGFEGVTGIINSLPFGISVQVEGYTDCASQDNEGQLFTLIRDRGALILSVFADVNQEYPTHCISLETARNRKT